jgi:hypothetical protein
LSNTALRGGLNAEITHHVCIITYRAKTFLCAESGCEKSFVRAEHLARHQLNVGPALEATHSRDTSLTRMKTGQTKYTHVLVVPRSSSARSCINDTNLDEKGMWYRQVRGVVEKSGGASRNRKNPLTPAGPPISPETLISSSVDVSLPQDSIEQTIREKHQFPVAGKYEVNIPFGANGHLQQDEECPVVWPSSRNTPCSSSLC